MDFTSFAHFYLPMKLRAGISVPVMEKNLLFAHDTWSGRVANLNFLASFHVSLSHTHTILWVFSPSPGFPHLKLKEGS